MNVLFEQDGVKIIRINSHFISKQGYRVTKREAETMKFIKQKTSIPVPKIESVNEINGEIQIMMEYIEGETLDKVWNNFSDKQKNDICEQLKIYINELKQIEGKYIGGINYSNCRDPIFIDNENNEHEPFNSESEFNDWIFYKIKEKRPSYYADILKLAINSNHKIVFTHGDFVPRNIIVKNNKIKAIIDWEMAGWYPEYWEFTKSLYRCDWKNDWVIYISKIMKTYPQELSLFINIRTILW